MNFPKGFIWGTAISAHQTEGNDTNCDWWEWEKDKPDDRQFPLEPSGVACDSYNRYSEDFDLCKELNNNAVRISLPWNRIEPGEGRFNRSEIEHYRKVLQAAKDRGLKTFVTLHHFTNPLWFAGKGGWTNFKSPQYFKNYAKKCAKEFGGLVDAFLTINEPQVYALMSYTNGMWPPNKRNYFLSLIVQINLLRAHIDAYKAIKSVGNFTVGLVKNIVWFEPHPTEATFLDKAICKFLYFLNCDLFLKPIGKNIDLLGLNYYFTTRISHGRVKNLDDVISDLGWWINPMGLEKILLDLKRFKFPIYITENGIADAKDIRRKKFIHDMLVSCYKAIAKGVDLRGYFHWTLIDNYEWHQGFWPKFGLVEIDKKNGLARIPRKSFYYYANICKDNKIELQE